MIKGALLKKVYLFFNKIITETKKDIAKIEMMSTGDKLFFNLIESEDKNVVYIIDCKIDKFKKLSFRYRDLYKVFSKIKSKDEVYIKRIENTLNIKINDTDNSLESIESLYTVDKGIKIAKCIVNGYLMQEAITRSKSLSSKGNMPYNSAIFFDIQNDVLKTYITNDIAISINTLQTWESEDFSFSINNESLSFFHKWLVALNDIDLEISIYDKFICFKTEKSMLRIKKNNTNDKEIITYFELLDKIDFSIKNEFKFKTLNILKCENKEEVVSINIQSDKDITVDRSIIINIQKTINEDTKFITTNNINTVLITNEEEGLIRKIILNTVN